MQFYGAPVVTAAISAAYFWADRSGAPLGRRILASAHGAAAALLNVAALIIWMVGISKRSFAAPFLWLHLVPVILILLSFFIYRGPKWMHFLQLPNVAALLWGLFIGSMAVTNEWL